MRLRRSAFKRARAAVAALTLAASFAASGVLAAPGGAKRIDVVAHDESVRSVLLRIGDLAHLSISMSEDVRGTVNLTLHGVTAAEAVHSVCSEMHLRCVREGNTVNVSSEMSVVLPLSIVPADRVAKIVHSLYPALSVRADRASNSLVLAGSVIDIQGARSIATGLDVRDATKPTSEAIGVRSQSASVVAQRLRALYPSAKITVVSRNTMLVSATPPDLAQIKTLVSGIDAPTPTPAAMPMASDAVKVLQRRPQDVARAVHAQVPHVRAAVSGSTVALTGSPEDVARAKTLIAQLDAPAYGARYVQIYRLRNVDAASVADLVRRSFPDVQVTVDASLNALSVTGTAADHQRITDGIARIDGTGGATSSGGDPVAPGAGGTASAHEIVTLQSIIPSQGYGSSTSATDIAQAVQQAMSGQAPDLHVVVPNGTQQIILTGTPQSVRAAKALIAELDIVPPSVVLDTEILEIDESSSKNLGLQLGTSISATFSEITPTPDPVTGQTGRLIRLQPLTRTGLSLGAVLNLLIQNGKGRVLADPRITTLSGRTATIRAGDSISILTTTGGGTGTVATTQLQTFQTGVTLDITPIVTTNGEISVALHPVVNSLSGYLNNVPQISTRDTQTQVHLHDNETLVIGGLIQESTQSQENKVPLLGDLPLIGRVFRNTNTTSTRNELIIVVTPHLLGVNGTSTVPTSAQPGAGLPTPQPLPTLPPNLRFPAAAPPQPSPLSRTKPSATGSPVPAGSPIPAPSVSPSPGVTTPAAFAQANVYVYGSPPPSTYAAPGDAPVIFYASFSPTVLTPNATVRVNAITTTNVQKLRIGTQSTSISLSQVANGTWQGVFSANALNLPTTATTVQLTLTASRGDGQSASITLPVSLMHQEQVL